MTAGFYALNTMWAAVKGAGLIDLLLASGNKPKAPQLRPYQSLTVNCIMTGNTPKDLSRDCAIALKYCMELPNALPSSSHRACRELDRT